MPFDPSTAVEIPQAGFDPSTATEVPPPAPRGALSEIGAAGARGVLVGLPTLVGQSLQYTSKPGEKLYEAGKGLVTGAENMGQKSWLQAQPESHGSITNAIASGAEMIGPAMAPAIALGAGAGLVGASPVVAPIVGMLGAGALFGAQAGQSTLDKAEKAGVAPDVAKTAARVNAAQTFATQTALNLVGGKMLGLMGSATGKVVAAEGAPLASSVMSDLAGTSGVLKPFLKQLPASTAEAVGINMAQAGITAGVEQHYGIDKTSPWEAAQASIGPTLGLTAIMTPLGLVSRAAQVRSAQTRTSVLAHPDAPPEVRSALADQYAAVLAKTSPTEAAAFRANADVAIKNKMVMDVNSSMLMPDAVQAPAPETGVPRIGYTPQPMIVSPGGEIAKSADAMDAYVNSLPEDQRPAARAKIMGLQPQPADVKPVPVTPDVQALHEQVKAALIDAGETPAAPKTKAEFADLGNGTALKGQALVRAYRDYLADPETQVALMRADADKYDALQARPAAPEDASPTAPAARPAAPEQAPANPAMALAMRDALKARDTEVAYATQEATKAAQVEAIANITKGGQLADDALAGKVTQDVNAPKPMSEITSDWKAAMEANGMDTKQQALVPFTKRMEALGLDGMKTHQEQIDAVQGLLDGKARLSDSTRDRMQMVLDRWKADMPVTEDVAKLGTPEGPVAKAVTDLANGEPPKVAPTEPAPVAALEGGAPAFAKALDTNLPENKPSDQAQSPKAAAVFEDIPTNLHASNGEFAQTIADKATAILADFSDRLHKGEELSPLERERYDDARAFRDAALKLTEGNARASDADYLKDLAKMTDEAGKPYTQTLRKEGDTGSLLPGARLGDATWMAPAETSGKALDVAANLAKNAPDDFSRNLASKLMPFLGDTTISHEPPHTFGVVGEYLTKDNHVAIYSSTPGTILHEMVHAAVFKILDTAQDMVAPKNQSEARMLKAYLDLEDVRHAAVAEAQKTFGPNGQQQHYGLTNVHEFMSEALTNKGFQDFLQSRGGKTSMWSKVVSSVRSMFGLDPKNTDLLSQALRATEQVFDVRRDFDSSPAGAVGTTETVMRKVIEATDRDNTPWDSLKVATDTAARAIFTKLLPAKTVDYIAHQIRVIPEMVASGFAAGVDAHQKANMAHSLAIDHLSSNNSKYVTGLERVLGAMGDTKKAMDLQRDMMTIGGEASRVGFDYRKNGADNLLANPKLDPKDKPYMDDIHRKFTQMQRLNPEAAAALETGEKLNRTQLIEKVSTISANLMDARAGNYRRLAAELERLSPTDANRAALEAQVKIASLEQVLADAHSKRLDFMDPTLANEKNTDAARYHTGASAALAARLDAAFNDAKMLPEGTPMREHMMALEAAYRPQLESPYFSLGRDGDYFVKVGFKDMDAAANARIQEALQGTNKVVGDLTRGDPYAYFRVKSMGEAESLGAKLVRAGEGKVVDSAWGLQAEHVNDAMGTSPALRGLLGALDDAVSNNKTLDPAQAALMKATITRQVLSMLPETAARSASMGRKGIPGYDGDFMGSFSRRALGGVTDTAGLYTSRAYEAAAKMRMDAMDGLNRTGSADGRVRAQAVDNEINKRYADMMRPVGNPAIGLATSLGHSFYLGLSPANFIRTMVQPWHRGLPILGSRFGFTSSAAEMVRATPVAMQIIAQSLKAAVAKDGVRGMLGTPIELQGLNLKPSEQAFLQEMHARGILDLGEGSQLQRAARGGGSRMQDAVKIASVTVQLAEMSNRLIAGLAAFRLAEKNPKLLGNETIHDYVLGPSGVVNRAMDNFDPTNTARAIGKHGVLGSATPLFTQFQNYNLQTMQQIARTAHDGLFNQDKSPMGLQRSMEARREFGGLMATTAVISGALGLPFANAFAGVYNNLMQDADDPKDIRVAMRNWAADTFGPEVGGVLMSGIGHAANLDTSSMGLSGLLPGSDFLADRAMWKDRADTQAHSMMGPAVSILGDLGTAVSRMSDGYYVKALEAALPVGLRSYYKTAEMAGLIGPGGYTDTKGNPIPLKAGASDLAWRALGFQSATKADQGAAQRDMTVNQERLDHRKQVIGDMFYKGATQQDPEQIAEGAQALQNFNAKNPTMPIRDVGSLIRQHLTGLALGEASGTGVSMTKRQFPSMSEKERFSAMPTR